MGIYLQVFVSPIFDENGEVVSVVHIAKDITERKKAEKELKNSEEYLKIILNSVHVGIMLINAETHKILNINSLGIKMFGVPREQIVGRVCHEFVCPAEIGKCPITDLKQNVDYSERLLIKYNGEKIPILKSVVPITQKGRSLLIESFIDITERKKAEEQQKGLMKDLEEANRIMTGRELRMIELKEEVNELSRDLRRPAPYDLSSSES